MKVGYVRVSTVEQNEARQIEGLQKYGIDRWYIEKVSGKNTNRAKLQEMISALRSGFCIRIKQIVFPKWLLAYAGGLFLFSEICWT